MNSPTKHANKRATKHATNHATKHTAIHTAKKTTKRTVKSSAKTSRKSTIAHTAKTKLTIGVLALQGGVMEHILAVQRAADKLNADCSIIQVRSKDDLKGLHGLIIPGGESTVLQKLCEREGLMGELKKIPAIFGTCAGAIMLAKKINNREAEQRTLELMDIELDRNGYGRQNESFEQDLDTALGRVHAIFIRAPRLKSILSGESVKVLAKDGQEVFACEQRINGKYYLVSCFHPELSTTLFHEHFLRNAIHLKS